MADESVDRGDDFIPTGDDAVDEPKTPPVITEDDKAAVGVDDAALAAKAAEKAAAETAAAEGEGDKKPKKDSRIPLARHEELLNKERERRETAERALENSKQAERVAVTNDEIAKAETKLLDLEAAHAKQVTDGDAGKAATTMGEIRKLERSIIQAQSTFEVQAAEARAYERVRYDSTVERLEAAYPALNEDHADFDKELMAEVVELRNGFIATGKYTRAEAIQKAAKTLIGAQTTRQVAAVETGVRVDAKDVAKAAGDGRTTAARTKAADAAAKQPANMNTVGLDSSAMGGGLDAKAVMKMNQTEFAKLDEKTLARLRGDELV